MIAAASDRKALRALRQWPSLLTFAEDSVLLAVARTKSSEDVRLRRDLAVECALRLWINGGGGLARWTGADLCLEALQALGWESACDPLRAWAESQATNRQFEVPEGLSVPWRTHLQRSLSDWKDTQGLAVLTGYLDAPVPMLPARVLPFLLHRGESSAGECPVRCADDAPLTGLSQGVSAALRAFSRDHNIRGNYNIVLLGIQGDMAKSLEGNSLGLAVYLALLCEARKRGHSAFECAASGELNAAGQLSTALDTYTAKAAALRQAGVGQIVLPHAPEAYPESLGVTVITPGSVKSTLDKLVDSLPGQIARMDMREREGRLKHIGDGMRFATVHPQDARMELSQMLAQLDAENLLTHTARRLRLEARMHLAAALCHLGEPVAAQAECEGILAEAGSARIAAQVLIRNGVNMTDRGLYDDALRCFDDVAARLESIDAGDRHDIELQLQGSRGQTQAFHALLKPECFEESVLCLEEALALARDTDVLEDIARDACYICHTYALNRPQDAAAVMARHRETCVADAATLPYFNRLYWLAAYRHLLASGEWTVPPAEATIPQGNSYLRATSLKYAGALLAAAGDVTGALKHFNEADSILHEAPGLLGFIHAATLLQAGESLLPHRLGLGEHFLGVAITRFEGLEGILLHERLETPQWIARARALLQGTAPETHPQLFYPY